MWSALRKSLIHRGANLQYLIKENKRYAGHSKWANIKHDKAVKDSQKAAMFAKFIRQMNVAIAEEGSYKPMENLRLAQIIEIAKKKSMPMATINGVLERASKSSVSLQSLTIDVRGPGGCIIIIELLSSNIKGTKMLLNSVFKKFNITVLDQSARHVFLHKGFIITELSENLDAATETAITVGAEDVEEIEEEGQKCLKFTCDPIHIAKVTNLLMGLNYKIISSESKFLPQIYANLSDADVDRAEAFYQKLENMEEVVRLHDNIA